MASLRDVRRGFPCATTHRWNRTLSGDDREGPVVDRYSDAGASTRLCAVCLNPQLSYLRGLMLICLWGGFVAALTSDEAPGDQGLA